MSDNDLSNAAGEQPRVLAPFAVFRQPEVEAPTAEMFEKFGGEQPRIDHPSADPEKASFSEFVKRRTALRDPEGEPFPENGGIDPQYGQHQKLIPCICGAEMMVADGSTAQRDGTVHRTDGPCYKCEPNGMPSSGVSEPTEPPEDDEADDEADGVPTTAAYDRDEPAPWLTDIPD